MEKPYIARGLNSFYQYLLNPFYTWGRIHQPRLQPASYLDNQMDDTWVF